MPTVFRRVLREEMHTWKWVAVGFLGVVVYKADLPLLYDEYLGPPLIYATVEAAPNASGPPAIKYKAHARKAVSGTWTAYTALPDGTRLETRKGAGDYAPNDAGPKNWPWAAFFETNAPPPRVPDEPYIVCVFHTVRALDTGAWVTTDPACTDVIAP